MKYKQYKQVIKQKNMDNMNNLNRLNTETSNLNVEDGSGNNILHIGYCT